MEFTTGQRQAVIDSGDLLASAEITVPNLPSATGADGLPILAQMSTVDQTVFQQDALFHLDAASTIADTLSTELAEALQELVNIVAQDFTEDMLLQVCEWGFEILNKVAALARINNLTGN